MRATGDIQLASGETDGARPPGDPIRVVVIESAPACQTALRLAIGELDEVTIAGEVTDVEDGYREVMKVRPDLVIVELEESDHGEGALAMASRLADIYPQTAVFVTSSMQSAEIVKRAMGAGAREYLSRPIDGAEVQLALKKLLRQRAQAASSRHTTGQIVAVFAPKGGVGATFVATNLAVMLGGGREGHAAIVDLDLQMGDVATFLNIRPPATIVDVVLAGDQIDAGLLDSALATHTSGVQVLAPPRNAEDAERVEARHVGQLLILMKTQFEHVVVDLPHGFDAHTLEALDLADHILLVSQLELPTIHNTRRCLDVFEKLGYNDDRLKLVINRHHTGRGSERFERSFGYPVFWRLPNDYGTAISSINAGAPVTDVGPESVLAASLKGLAGRLDGRRPVHRRQLARPPRRFRLLRRLLPA